VSDLGTASPLSLRLHRERGGPVVAVEPVEERDLVDVVAEFWFQTDLRREGSASALGGLSARVRTVEREEPEIGTYIAGFELEADLAGGAKIARYFPRECLEHVAARRAKALLAEGKLEVGDLYYYAVVPSREEEERIVRGPAGRGAPALASVPLRLVREGADTFDVLPEDDDYPVFFTRDALERAERLSRKGGEAQPPVETGGLLSGPLCRCPETREIFSVVATVIEATQCEATKYSLTYSGATWSKIQTIVRAQQRQHATRHYRILGVSHGHNFLPFEGADPCEACEIAPVCTRSSAFLSGDDRTWSRAVFSGEPWQLSQVFGLDARSGPTETFYGQRDGSLARRGYHVIDELDPSWLV
jgi:hypothetical protein